MLNIEIARRFIKIKALILSDYFAKLNEIYNASKAVKEAPTYVSRAEREQLANDYFAK